MQNMNLEAAVSHLDEKEILIMVCEFESFSFHDNAIHGIFLPENEGEGTSPLIFDIDHIMEWDECHASECELFSISQGLLYFYNVTDLKINIEWKDSNYTSSEVGVYIVDVIRDVVKTTLRLPQYFKWKIITSDNNYCISFGASSMSLSLLGSPQLVGRQYLLDGERLSISKAKVNNKFYFG